MAEDQRKTELIAELARARARLTTGVLGLRADLDFAARGRRAFARHPAVWIGGALLLGLIMAKLPARTKKVVVPRKGEKVVLEKAGRAGLVFGALKVAFDFARPALTKWAARRAANYFSARYSREASRY